MNCAYVTIATNEYFLQGAYCLYQTYLQTNSKYPFYCVVPRGLDTSNFPKLPIIYSYNINTDPSHMIKGGPYVQPGVWSKIMIWSLVQFDYLFFFDADIVMLKNCDEFFDMAIDSMEKHFSDMFCTINTDDMIVNGQIRKDLNGNWFIIRPREEFFIKYLQYMRKGCYYESVALRQMLDQGELHASLYWGPCPWFFHNPWWDAHTNIKYWARPDSMEKFKKRFNL